MENRQLLLHILEDLDRRLRADTEYEILGIARLLRQLLIDGNRVVQAVISDQPVQLVGPEVSEPPRLRFEVANYQIPPARESSWWAIVDGFDPELEAAWRHFRDSRGRLTEYIFAEGLEGSQKLSSRVYPRNTGDRADNGDRVPRTPLTIDAFLHRTVMQYGRESFTVKDVLGYLANFGGAVHAVRPRDARRKALAVVMHQLQFGDLPIGLYMLLPIGRVALRALQPLQEHVKAGRTWARPHWRIDIVVRTDGGAVVDIKGVDGGASLVPSPARAESSGVNSG